MSRQVLRVTWFRFRAGLRRRAGGYLSIVLLVGMLGGVAMGAIAAARRTQSSFPAYMKSTNPSDLRVVDLSQVTVGNHVSDFEQKLAGLPNVRRVASWGVPNVVELGSDGAPSPANADAEAKGVFVVASADGLYADQDRVTVVEGRMADPRRAEEIVMSAPAARALGDHVGSVHHLGFYTNDQANLPGFRTASVPPYFTLDVTLVGIVVFNNEVVQDDTDRLPTDVLLNPAIAGRLAQCCGSDGFSAGLQLDHGARDVSAVESEIANAIPTAVVTSVTSTQVAKAERAIEPEAIALGVFGGIAALAALLIAGQVIGRQLRLGANEVGVLRGLGASPAMTATDGLIGIVGAIIVGAVLACGVAIAVSPLSPLGPVRAVDPTPGISFDWTVLGLGLMVLIAGLAVLATAMARRVASVDVGRRGRHSESRPSRFASAVSIAGVPPSTAVGIRFAVEPGSGKNAAPVRSAMLGGGLAVVVIVGTLIFGASLHTLVSRPALYGWNWDYELRSAYSGISNIPQDKAKPLLDGDADVAAWVGVYFATAQIDGLTVPVLGTDPGAPVAPSMLSGHALENPNEVVLGATTLAQLHKHPGDTVSVTLVSGQPTPLVIVGTAALPAVGIAVTLHMGLTTGAVVSQTIFPADDRGFGDQDGPQAFFVRFRPGVDPSSARQKLQTVADGMYTDGDGPVTVLPVQRPAEIVNYRSMGTAPTVLGAGLAVGAISALALTLIASVRRRRRDLALLKTLGFTRRQLAATVAWQSTMAAAVGTMGGVPIGIIVGRWLWTRFANGIHVVPHTTVPAVSIALVAFAAVVLANIVAAIPARSAARTPAAALLRAD
ncbi:MAG TPA: FtsX-like permease family protein [Ilumatobacteraceae bacterium]|nr:FtsX-like permease family protein [Ilumatobacteraceae bacterium]